MDGAREEADVIVGEQHRPVSAYARVSSLTVLAASIIPACGSAWTLGSCACADSSLCSSDATSLEDGNL